MIDFEKLDRLFEVTYDENKACMFAYVWAKKKESDELESKKHIKLSDAFNKVKDHKWHFYPGDENNLTTYLVTGLLNKELGAFETDDVTLFLFSLGNKTPFSDIYDTNGILDTTTKEINSARHNVNFMLGFWTEFNLIKGVDYKDEKIISMAKGKYLSMYFDDTYRDSSKYYEFIMDYIEKNNIAYSSQVKMGNTKQKFDHSFS